MEARSAEEIDDSQEHDAESAPQAPERQREQNDLQDNEIERHHRFVMVLEEHGPNACTERAWEHMATALGWSTQEVKRYAYSYLMALDKYDSPSTYAGSHSNPDKRKQHEQPQQEAITTRATTKSSNEPSATSNMNSDCDLHDDTAPAESQSMTSTEHGKAMREPAEDDWSWEEQVLFDNLVLRYGPETSKEDDVEEVGKWWMEPTRWERIAAMFPGRTSIEIHERYLGVLKAEQEQRQRRRQQCHRDGQTARTNSEQVSRTEKESP